MGNAFCQHTTEATADFFLSSLNLIGGGLVASQSLVELLVSAVRGFTSRVLDSGVFNFGLLGPLPA